MATPDSATTVALKSGSTSSLSSALQGAVAHHRGSGMIVGLRRSGGGGIGSTAVGTPVVEAPLVAAQALLQPFNRLVDGGVGVVGMALGLQRDAGGQMQHHVGTEGGAVRLQRHVAGGLAVEILGQGGADALARVKLQGLADVQVLA